MTHIAFQPIPGSALTCVLISWSAGDAPDALTSEAFSFTREEMDNDQSFFEIEILEGYPVNFGFVEAQDTVMARVNNHLEAYPSSGEFVTFGYPQGTALLFLTLLHSKNVTIACCHDTVMPPSLLLDDYESETFQLAKYVTIPLPPE